MAQLLGDPAERIAVVPLGINMDGYAPPPPPADARDGVFRVGYFARIAPEKGPARARRGVSDLPPPDRGMRSRYRLEAARVISRARTSRISTEVKRRLAKAGLGGRVHVSRRGRSRRQARVPAHRSTCSRCRRPTTSRRACSCSRRWRAACRWCSRGAARSPRSSRRPAAACSSRPDDPAALADGLYALWSDRARARALGRRGFNGVRAHYSVERSADRLLDVYESMKPGGSARTRATSRELPIEV